ncbi:MAG: MotA/TolQ/ExbB proton channel family protein [Henriciella sp.]|nr:MotA/TolQ/ExbB proton channel family protein [Henriciella sp.]
MVQLIGFAIVLLVVLGGLLVSGGPAVMQALPFELGLIGGAAFGTLLIGNAPDVAKRALSGFYRAVRGARWKRSDYTDLLATLHELTSRVRKGGVIAIEQDIEAPHASELFKNNPRLLEDEEATALICDTFRLLALDPAASERSAQHLEESVYAIVENRQRAVGALHTLSDALPALGIVAAVLGIIKTMGVIDQSPAVLGEMIAAALLGTFLGVFLAYGLVGPVATRFGQIVDEEALYLDTIRNVLSAHTKKVAPGTAIELARAALPAHLKPDLGDMDLAISAARFRPSLRVA